MSDDPDTYNFSKMTFSTLAIIAIVGMFGPVLALRRNLHMPVILGELAAGFIFGITGFGVLNASDHTFTFLADIGFAVTMFVAGSHVPVRDPAVRAALGVGAARAVGVGVVATIAGIGISSVFGTSHAALYAVLMASSSAALVLPIIDGLGLKGTSILQMTAQVAIADTVCIVALPLVIDPANAGRAALGALAVAACAVVLFFALREFDKRGTWRRLHKLSEHRKFALELRINLAILFTLSALAMSTHVSIMLAGFAFGLAVAGVGEPRRLAKQLFAINDGFLGPLFFVWLGSSIDLRDFADRPSFIVLGLCLGAGAIVVHVLMRLTGQPSSLGLLAASQLGVPVAAVTVGKSLGVLQPGESAAMILGALITIVVAAVAGSVAARTTTAAPTAAPPAKSA